MRETMHILCFPISDLAETEELEEGFIQTLRVARIFYIILHWKIVICSKTMFKIFHFKGRLLDWETSLFFNVFGPNFNYLYI